MKRILCVVLGGLFISVLNCSSVWAQATAQISGTVKDQSGAVLPGVEVTVTQTDTGIARSAVTNETGSYVLPNLPIGPYRLEAGLPGFRTFAQTGIVLQVNASPVINPVLEVGQVTEQVEVQANAALVETRSVGVGSVVENARILDLPLNGRAVVELIALAGAATPAPLNNGSNRDHFAQVSFSVAGGLNNGLNYTLDGATHNNPQDNGYLSVPFPDALQEFKLETSGTGAQTGMKSAGTVSLVTKSGTNAFHGDLFEFVRNGKFNARNAFATRRDTIKRNQFGGTLGGPIVQSKMFFFGGYQGTTLRQDPSDSIAFVPTAAMLVGDFTEFASPSCNGGRQITLRAPFANNRIDPALFSKAAVLFAGKLPKTADPCGRIIYAKPTLTNEHQAVGKIDYQKSAEHSLFGRYLLHSVVAPASFDINQNPLTLENSETGLTTDALAQSFIFGSTYLLSANVVNAFRFTANRIADGKFESDAVATAGLGPADIGITKAFHYSPHSPRISVTGGFSAASFGGSTRSAIFGANDDISILRGNHQFAFGGQGTLWWNNSYSTTNHESNSFTGATTGLGMSDFFMGKVASYNAGTTGPMNKRAKFVGLYAADTWKMSQKLTLNYGLRWEPYFPLIPLAGGAIHYDEEALKKGIKSTQYDNTPPGVFFVGDPGWHTGKSDTEVQWWNFSPRVGLAWDVSGDGRTAIRASVGTFYDFPSTNYQNPATAPPWSPRYTLSDVDFEDPWGKFPGGDPFPVKYGKDIDRTVQWPFYGLVTATDYDTKNMEVTSWNLSLQKQVGADWLVSANYLGSESYHIWGAQQINAPIFLGLGPCTLAGVQYSTCSTAANLSQRRRLSIENPVVGQYYGYVVKLDYGGTASYNGLLLSVQRRPAQGVTVGGNYTWSHCISDTGAGDNKIFGGTPNSSWQDPSNRRLDRGNCGNAATDRRHVLNLSAVAETPRFSNAALRVIGSGWRFSPIFKVLSGGYMSITTSQDRALSGTTAQRVNRLLHDPYGAKTVNNYLNPAAFALPALGTLGNAGAFSVRGPGTWQFDIALSRTLQLREAQKLEFRAEAFNVTNSFRMEDPTSNFNSGNFGQVTSARDPRIMQFALKYVF